MALALRQGLAPTDPATLRMQTLATEADRQRLELTARLRLEQAREP
jgi:hypothetical protein